MLSPDFTQLQEKSRNLTALSMDSCGHGTKRGWFYFQRSAVNQVLTHLQHLWVVHRRRADHRVGVSHQPSEELEILTNHHLAASDEDSFSCGTHLTTGYLVADFIPAGQLLSGSGKLSKPRSTSQCVSFLFLHFSCAIHRAHKACSIASRDTVTTYWYCVLQVIPLFPSFCTLSFSSCYTTTYSFISYDMSL